MNLKKTSHNTWIFSDLPEVIMVGFDGDNPHLLSEGLLEIDYLDGSFYDSDGDEKKLLVKCQNGTTSFETLPEDYSFWKGTENCKKKGCLGYVEELLNDLKEDNATLEYNIHPYKIQPQECWEVYLWHVDYAEKRYPELMSSKKNKLRR